MYLYATKVTILVLRYLYNILLSATDDVSIEKNIYIFTHVPEGDVYVYIISYNGDGRKKMIRAFYVFLRTYENLFRKTFVGTRRIRYQRP